MKFYDTYSSTIREALKANHLSKGSEYTKLHGLTGDISLVNESKNISLAMDNNLTGLAQIMKFTPSTNSKLGEHPDFAHLKGAGNHEMHYITSAFIDIKGSTNLHKWYDLHTIYTITNTIQLAAINTCTLFGGHIQRLQGDGVFVYFGGKNIQKNKAVEAAIAASSFFTYFVKNDLKRIFEEEGVENIYTRIGIDFGDDEKVMWASFGSGDCCELTTNSLHTSLASKMQSHANANGIVVGDNIKENLELDESYFKYVQDSNGNMTRYIFEDRNNSFYYTQYRFEWFRYLKNLPFIRENEQGELYYVTAEEIESERIAKLRETAALIQSRNAFTDRQGIISNDPSGVINQNHRFHYEE